MPGIWADCTRNSSALSRKPIPNFRLVLQRAPENILWNRWNDTLVEAAGGAFDAYDDHRYAFYGWDKYFDKDGDDILTPGKPIEGKEAILGECNIGWTPVQDNWNAGHVRDLGGGMALLNALLDMVNREQYSQILTWPSQWPSKASIVNDGMDKGFGWFDLDAWYLTGDTQRFTGPVLAHRILNQNVLENKLNASSTASTVRVFSYENTAANDLRVIVINKWDPTTLTLQVLTGIPWPTRWSCRERASGIPPPDYVSHLGAGVAVSGGVLQDAIPGECVVVYHFSADSAAPTPAAPALTAPRRQYRGQHRPDLLLAGRIRARRITTWWSLPIRTCPTRSSIPIPAPTRCIRLPGICPKPLCCTGR